MAGEYRIIQLSDCHLSADPEALYRGIAARRTLERMVDIARSWGPDLFLVTGDLSEDGSEASYDYLAGLLQDTGIPVVTTPGNHDPAALQQRFFPRTPLESPLTVTTGDWQTVVLNSSVAGEVPGLLSDRMCSDLQALLQDIPVPILLVLHHQPVSVGSAWIDRYPLLEAGRFWSLVDAAEGVRAVIWGHIHHAYRAMRDGILLLGGASTVANSLPARDEFTLDPAGPACRWLKLGPGGRLSAGLLRDYG